MNTIIWMSLGILITLVVPNPLWAASDSADESPQDKTIQWGGYVKTQETVSWPDKESIFKPVGTGTYYDNTTEFRLNNTILFSKWGYFETHYEAAISGGDTRRKLKELEELSPGLFESGLVGAKTLDDRRRLMNLTSVVHENDNYILAHRLDRLSLTLQPEWGTVRLGRQALTWGNGLLFNPMDLFNPFAPTDIVRYYKVGDDMATTQFNVENIGDVQLLYVPRRDPEDHEVKWNQSSLAGKIHFASGTNEFDVMGAAHYNDGVLGFGSTGYLGAAAWRMDATWTFLDDKSGGRDNFVSLVANMDYSWVWWERNFYGLIEFYYNGLGDNDYTKALNNPQITERIIRGEMFTLGRFYMATRIQVELHPLVNFNVNLINNLHDPSGIIQPRIVWDVAQNVQFVFGGGIYYGKKGTEFGGFKISGSELLFKPANNVFAWLTYFY